MRTVKLSTLLNASVQQVWNEVNKPRLLLFVAHPVLHFIPVEPATLPKRWENGDYIFKLWWRGFVPLGKQVVCISRPSSRGEKRLLRDNGHSALAKRWDHLITVDPEGDMTRYTDRIDIDAGIATPIVAAFARKFYSHRQRRWHELVDSDFRYGLADITGHREKRTGMSERFMISYVTAPMTKS